MPLTNRVCQWKFKITQQKVYNIDTWNPGNKQMWYLCESKDFGPKRNETKWNFVKTESEVHSKLLLNSVNFCSSSGQNLPKFKKTISHLPTWDCNSVLGITKQPC